MTIVCRLQIKYADLNENLLKSKTKTRGDDTKQVNFKLVSKICRRLKLKL